MRRTATSDIEFRGKQIRKDDKVVGEPEGVLSNFVRGYKTLPVRLHRL